MAVTLPRVTLQHVPLAANDNTPPNLRDYEAARAHFADPARRQLMAANDNGVTPEQIARLRGGRDPLEEEWLAKRLRRSDEKLVVNNLNYGAAVEIEGLPDLEKYHLLSVPSGGARTIAGSPARAPNNVRDPLRLWTAEAAADAGRTTYRLRRHLAELWSPVARAIFERAEMRDLAAPGTPVKRRAEGGRMLVVGGLERAREFLARLAGAERGEGVGC
ncbi:MAG TPA: hypothetical protein VHD15_15595 [Hyphomicrobiales bacterium]|nr:hypothetical protein [Hyphomicrobiales bacterium]